MSSLHNKDVYVLHALLNPWCRTKEIPYHILGIDVTILCSAPRTIQLLNVTLLCLKMSVAVNPSLVFLLSHYIVTVIGL